MRKFPTGFIPLIAVVALILLMPMHSQVYAMTQPPEGWVTVIIVLDVNQALAIPHWDTSANVGQSIVWSHADGASIENQVENKTNRANNTEPRLAEFEVIVRKMPTDAATHQSGSTVDVVALTPGYWTEVASHKVLVLAAPDHNRITTNLAGARAHGRETTGNVLKTCIAGEESDSKASTETLNTTTAQRI